MDEEKKFTTAPPVKINGRKHNLEEILISNGK
jgi:hypothetical protein